MRTIITTLSAFMLSYSAFAAGTEPKTSAMSSATFVAASDGSWVNPAIWQVTGSDADGIPDADDDVIIQGFDVTISAPAACNNLSITSGGDHGSLTVSATFIVNANTVLNNSSTFNYSLIVLSDATFNSGIAITGTTATAGELFLQIGNSTNAPLVTIGGPLNMTAHASAANNNLVRIYNGTLDLNDNITFSGPTGTLRNIIQTNDDGIGDGLTKQINWAGTIDHGQLNQGQFTLVDADNDANYTFRYDGTADQAYLVNGTNNTFKTVLIATSGGKKTYLPANLNVGATLATGGAISIQAGAIFSDSSNAISNSSGQITIQNNGTYRRVNNSTYSLGSFTYATPSGGLVPIFEFRATTGTVDVLTEVGTYPKVLFTGSGTKNIAANFTGYTIPSIQVSEGTVLIADPVSNVNLSNTSGYDNKVTVSSGATLNIASGSLTAWTSNFDIMSGSTFNYSFDGVQKILKLTNGSTHEEYAHLTLSGASAAASKFIAANDTIKVTETFTLGGLTGGNVKDHADLDIKNGANLTLVSNNIGTARMDSVGTNNSIIYNTSGTITCQRYIQFTAKNWVDFTTPISTATIEDFEQSGLLITGITGSDYSGEAFKNVRYYNEASVANDQTDFVAPASTSETFIATSSGKITRSGMRIYAGANSTVTETLSVSGQVHRDSVRYNLSFTNSTGDDATHDGWNFIGNPFMSNISLDTIYKYNKAAGRMIHGTVTEGFRPTFYVHKKTDNDTNGVADLDTHYGFYNASTGLASSLPNGDKLAPFQGFWVQTLAPTDKSFDFAITESAKTSGTQRFYKANAPATAQIIASTGNHSNMVMIHEWEGAQVGKDLQYDVLPFEENLSSRPIVLRFYDEEPIRLWVNALPAKQQELSVPLHLTDLESGQHTLTFNNIEAMGAHYDCITLYDRITQTSTAVRNGTVYSYQNAGPYEGVRFDLIFSKSVNPNVSSATCILANDGKIEVTFDQKANRHYSLFKGNQVVQEFSGEWNQWTVENLAAGSYELTNQKASESCNSRIIPVVVSAKPEIAIVAYPSTNPITQGVEVQMINQTAGAESFIWTFFDDNSTSTEAQPYHTFNQVGPNLVKLEAVSLIPVCTQTKMYELQVEQGTGITDSQSKPAEIIWSGGQLSIASLPADWSSASIWVYGTDGRLLAHQIDVRVQSTIAIGNHSSSILVHLVESNSAGSKKLSKHIIRK